MVNKWVEKINRPFWTPTFYSRVCGLHFKPEDFLTHSNDRDHSNRFNKKLQNRRLKPESVPSIFPATFQDGSDDSNVSDEKKQFPEVAFREQQLKIAKEMLYQVESFEDLLLKIETYAEKGKLPAGFTLVKSPRLALIKLVISEMGYSVEASVEFNSDLTFNMFHKSKTVTHEEVSHIVKSRSIKSIREVFDVANFLRSMT